MNYFLRANEVKTIYIFLNLFIYDALSPLILLAS